MWASPLRVILTSIAPRLGLGTQWPESSAPTHKRNTTALCAAELLRVQAMSSVPLAQNVGSTAGERAWPRISSCPNKRKNSVNWLTVQKGIPTLLRWNGLEPSQDRSVD